MIRLCCARASSRRPSWMQVNWCIGRGPRRNRQIMLLHWKESWWTLINPTAFRLDWMQEGEQDFQAAEEYLCAIVRDTRPDFLHLNQLSFGALPVATPRLVVAH